MLSSLTSTGIHGLAVALAACGAVLFGLAAVRQHGAVQYSMSVEDAGGRQSLGALWRMVRRPSWLIGSLQGALGGGLHVLALTLAPITLVQPIGVLAVPVTVVATAFQRRRRPRRRQMVGSVLSVGSIAALTVLLIAPAAATKPVLPQIVTLVLPIALAVVGALLIGVLGQRAPALLRCTLLAAAAAVLFGLTSVLVRTVGRIIGASDLVAERGVLLTALIGIALCVPSGVWAMQTAYISGSPQVVICVLTLLDPLAAVVGGHFLLNDGVALTAATTAAVSGCALLAAVGVVLLSADYPVEATNAPDATRRREVHS